MNKRPMFHFRNANPEDMQAILYTIGNTPELPNKDAILKQAEYLGFVIRDRKRLEALTTARDLELVERSRNVLTKRGDVILSLLKNKTALFPDIFHSLLYTTWNVEDNLNNCFSWTYRTLCNLLWNSISMKINAQQLASQIADKARQEFQKLRIEEISISSKSANSALEWLRILDPPCISDDNSTFNRRTFCNPELLLLAIDFVYRENKVPYNSNLPLNDEVRDDICRACLLAPESFDETLSWTSAQFDFLKKSVGGGWGSYLLLSRKPELTDLV